MAPHMSLSLQRSNKLIKADQTSSKDTNRPNKHTGSQSGQTRTASTLQSKNGVLEALAAGVMSAVPQVKQVYRSKRPKDVLSPKGEINGQGGHYFYAPTSNLENRNFTQVHHGGSWPVPPRDAQLTTSYGSPHANWNPGSGTSRPLHLDPSDDTQSPPNFNEGLPSLGFQNSWYKDHEDQSQFTRQFEHIQTQSPELLRIENIILRAGQDIKGLHVPESETVEQAVHRLISQYRDLSRRLGDAHESLRSAHDLNRENQARSETLMAMEKELNSVKDRLRVRSSELVDKEQELSAKRLETLKAQQMLGEQHNKNANDINQLTTRIQNLQYQHGEKLRAEQQEYRDRVAEFKKSCDEKISRARTEEAQRQDSIIVDLRKRLYEENRKWDVHVGEVKKRYEDRIQEDKLDSDRRLREQREQYEREIRLVKEDHNKMVTEHSTQIAVMKATAEEEKSRICEELRAAKKRIQDEQEQHENDIVNQQARLEKKYKEATLTLRSTNEELKLGLFERKHFKGLRDRDLTGKFGTIVAQVRDFSNLEWDTHRESSWPFAEHQLLQIHRSNTRVLKKQILQNSLWVVLYECILRSPFRILGVEGGEYDFDWLPIHAPDSTSLEWPKISPEAEEARRKNAKSFLTALEPSAIASGDALRLKNSYDDAVMVAKGALRNALERVAGLEDRHLNMLDSLVRLCATTWLEFCTQKYRLLVSLPKGSGDLLSSPRSHERTLALVISPELKRYGNSEGANLLLGEVVPSCQAAVQSYPSR